MCIIVHKPAKEKIERSTLLECFRKNPDGAGISYVDGGELVIKKGIRSADEVADLAEANMDKELVIHFRIASPGMITDNLNTHPFLVEAQEDAETKKARFQYAIAHNGRLEWGHTNTKSDTNLFTEQFLAPMFESHPWVLTYEWGMIALKRTILHKERLNKMVIMMYDRKLNESEVFIINEEAGNMSNGCWFSNYSWMPPAPNYGQSFFPGHGNGAGRSKLVELLDELTHYKFWCEPDANGWFWSYVYDGWVNRRTGCISRSHTRSAPKYFQEPTYTPRELHGKMFLTEAEMVTTLEAIYDNIKRLNRDIAFERDRIKKDDHVPVIRIDPGEGSEDRPMDKCLDHLDGNEKSLLCKKAYDVLKWAGIGKKELAKMDAFAKVNELRSWVLGIFDSEPESSEIEAMKGADLDRWIIKKIKDGELTIDKIDKMWESKYSANVTPIKK